MKEPEFQIYQCEDPDCRFRCPNDLSHLSMEKCPVCGESISPVGKPFTNFRLDPGSAAAPSRHVEVVLDNLRSTLNVGSIFRTADGAGVAYIHCCGTTPTPRHPKIAKSGLGAEDFIAWAYHRNALDVVRKLKEEGNPVICLESTASSEPLFGEHFVDVSKAVLVMGNEVSGVDPAILALADRVLFIPMTGRKSSINVAVAFGIAIYAMMNQ
jgi:23S rRNA (guanosine2251-2'-O)-methyltransferase